MLFFQTTPDLLLYFKNFIEKRFDGIKMKTNGINDKIDEALYYMQNDTERAITIFDEILEIEPENIEAINGKGSSLMKLNHMNEAENYFDYSLSIKQSPSAFISKGIICKCRKDYNQSLIYYDKAIEINPDLDNIIKILKNEINELIGDKIGINMDYSPETNELIKKGTDYKNNCKLWDALDCYENAIKSDRSCKKSVQALINEVKAILQNELMIKTPKKGDSRNDQLKIKSLRLLLIEKDPKQALTIMNIILDDDEEDIDTLNQKEESIECFNKCLSIDENYIHALFNKAIVLRRIKEFNDSLSCFDELLKTPQNYDKVKPYQLEILDKLHEKDITS